MATITKTVSRINGQCFDYQLKYSHTVYRFFSSVTGTRHRPLVSIVPTEYGPVRQKECYSTDLATGTNPTIAMTVQ